MAELKFWEDLSRFKTWQLRNYKEGLKRSRKEAEKKIKKIRKEIHRIKTEIVKRLKQ